MTGARFRFFLCFLFTLSAALAGADLYGPNRPLRIIRTRWFDIHYPEDARASAQRLASGADDAYREIAASLGVEPRLRFPVVLTPDPESANGYFTVWPSRRIVVYLAPSDPNGKLGNQSDDLYSVFRHELAHAVSLTIRPAFWDILAAVFGDPAGISFYATPSSLAEGAAIAVEDRDGRGRSRDPLSVSEVRQDALEGCFKSFWESAGAWDRYPYGSLPYSYGALFARYLREEYGEESYVRLWAFLGEGLVLPGTEDFLFIRGAFRRAYGFPLDKAWKDFEAWAAPKEPVLEARRIAGPGRPGALAASGDTVYWSDSAARRICSLDAVSGEPLASWPGDSSVSRLDASADGSRLLVSYLRYEKGIPRLALRELTLEDGRFRDLPYGGLRDAACSPGGIAAIRAEPDAASLVVIRGGVEETILPGGPRLSYASPCASRDGRWIYALRREDGAISVVRVEEPRSDSPDRGPRVQRLVLPDRFRSIRYLSVDDGDVLRFSWEDGSSFYRLAAVRDGRCLFQTESVSGGVHRAVSSGGKDYYLGYFSEGAFLCAFGTGDPAPGLGEASVRWEELPVKPPEPADSPSGGEEAEPEIDPGRVFPSRPYSVLPWLRPRFWYPAASLSSGRPWSMGAWFFGADPAETFAFSLGAEWIPSIGAADLSARLTITAFPPIISLEAYDGFSPGASSAAQRTAGAGISSAWEIPLYAGRFLAARVGAEALGFSSVPEGTDPYGPFEAALAAGTAAVSYGRFAYDVRRPAALKGARTDLTGFAAFVLPPGDPGFLMGAEAALRLRVLPLSLALDLFGALSFTPSLSYGPDGRSFAGFRSSASYPGYASFSGSASGPAYAYADASAAPLVLEAARRLGPLYLQRFILRTGGRAAVSDGALLYSGYARLTLAFAPLLGVYAELRPEAWAEADYAPGEGRWTLRYALELPL